MNKTEKLHVPELDACLNGLRLDMSAVKNAIALDYSQANGGNHGRAGDGYPRYYAGIDRRRRTRAVVLWASAFEEDDPRLVAGAVRSFIETDGKGFPPVPGQIKAKMRLITAHGELSENDAWNTGQEHLKYWSNGGKYVKMAA